MSPAMRKALVSAAVSARAPLEKFCRNNLENVEMIWLKRFVQSWNKQVTFIYYSEDQRCDISSFKLFKLFIKIINYFYLWQFCIAV